MTILFVVAQRLARRSVAIRRGLLIVGGAGTAIGLYVGGVMSREVPHPSGTLAAMMGVYALWTAAALILTFTLPTLLGALFVRRPH